MREPLKQQPDTGLGSLFNKLNQGFKQAGNLKGIAPITVKNTPGGTLIAYEGQPGDPTKWVEITDCDGENNKYSWVALKVDKDGEIVQDETLGKGDYTAEKGWAVEIAGCKHVLKGYRTRLYREGDNYSFKYDLEVAKGVVSEGLASGSEGDVRVDVTVNGTSEQQTIKARYDFAGQVEPNSTVYVCNIRDTHIIIAQDCPLPDEAGED